MKSFLVAIFLLLGTAGSATLFGANTAHAVSGSDWRAGRIIDDGLFYDNASMSLADIQNFLNARVPTCDTQGTQSAADMGAPGMTHAQYAASRGWPGPPYICLKDYYQVPRSDVVVNNYSGSIPAGSWSAARIIKNAADTYGISPKALLVTLQKESPGPLLSDTWPLQSQYRNAMGYGCPDTAPCDPAYEGFYNQITNAARQFKLYKDNPASYRYKPNQNNSIYYNPNTGCGASTVYVNTFATAGLYNYTPYQPNQAALNNLYGTGDGCSAYGNRNFWRIWNDWFGSPIAPDFGAEPVWQQVYTDSTKSSALGWDANLIAGQSAYAVVVMKNIGNQTWTKSGAFGVSDTRLATYGAWGRTSAFCDGNWTINCTRPAVLKEASVATGGYGTFEFPIQAPKQTGAYKEAFSPIVDGRTVFSRGSMTFNLNVYPAEFKAQPVWQQIYTDSTKSSALGWDANLIAGQSAYAVVVMKNTGNVTWTKSGSFGNTDTRLATYGPWGRTSGFCNDNWIINCTRPSGLKETSVAPGQYGTFEFPIQAPNQPGKYMESFAPIVDGRTVFSNGGIVFNINVTPAVFSAQPVWQQIYTDATKSTALGWNATLTANQPAYAVIALKNTGNVTWTKSGAFAVTDTRLATYGPWGRQSIFCSNNWLINCTRPAALNETSVAPGQTGTFEFPLRAPSQTGSYSEAFAPVIDGRTVFSSGAMGLNLTVQ